MVFLRESVARKLVETDRTSASKAIALPVEGSSSQKEALSFQQVETSKGRVPQDDAPGPNLFAPWDES